MNSNKSCFTTSCVLRSNVWDITRLFRYHPQRIFMHSTATTTTTLSCVMFMWKSSNKSLISRTFVRFLRINRFLSQELNSLDGATLQISSNRERTCLQFDPKKRKLLISPQQFTLEQRSKFVSREPRKRRKMCLKDHRKEFSLKCQLGWYVCVMFLTYIESFFIFCV